MFEAIKTFFSSGSIINAIEVLEVSGETKYHLIKTKLTKGELFIVEEFTSGSIEALQEKLTDKQPVHLIINTSSVLTKLLPDVTSSTEAIVNNAFPNIDFSKFNYELYRQNKSSIVCVCRKSVVNEILKEFENYKIFISKASLGVSKISALTRVLNLSGLALTNSVLKVSKDFDVVSINQRDTSKIVIYTIGDMEISNNQAIGFSSILHSFEPKSKLSSNTEVLNETLENNLFNRRFYYFTFRGVLGFLLLLLLVNFLVFSHYYSENAELNTQSLNNSTITEQLSTLKNLVGSKETQVKTIYGTSSSRVSLILDDIASQVPNDVSLTEMTYQPYKGSIRKNKPINYNVNTMLINGETSNREGFNNWVDIIENKDYTARVEILKFSYLNKNVSEFSLNLIIKDEAR